MEVESKSGLLRANLPKRRQKKKIALGTKIVDLIAEMIDSNDERASDSARREVQIT